MYTLRAIKEYLFPSTKRPLCCVVNPVKKLTNVIDPCCEAVDRCIDHHAPGCWRRRAPATGIIKQRWMDHNIIIGSNTRNNG